MFEQNEWVVLFHKRAHKALMHLPEFVREQVGALALEIRSCGPVRGNWKNYGKLGKDKHHCHLKNGHPTYVCCWQTMSNLKTVEIYYVGTHENAPY